MQGVLLTTLDENLSELVIQSSGPDVDRTIHRGKWIIIQKRKMMKSLEVLIGELPKNYTYRSV